MRFHLVTVGLREMVLPSLSPLVCLLLVRRLSVRLRRVVCLLLYLRRLMVLL